MAEYIERDKVLALQTDLHFDNIEQLKYWKCRHIDPTEVQFLPAADVRPVVRGKWIQTTQPMGWRDEDCAECSVCGEDFVLDEWAMDEFTNLMNFCPNCGADMRTGAE